MHKTNENTRALQSAAYALYGLSNEASLLGSTYLADLAKGRAATVIARLAAMQVDLADASRAVDVALAALSLQAHDSL